MLFPKSFFFNVFLFIVFSFTFLLTSVNVQAQHVVVHGHVSDSLSQQVLEEATVSLFRLPKTELVGSKRSDTAFAFSNLSKGNYVLVTSYQGYRTDSVHFSIKGKDTNTVFLNILLIPEENNLLQVVVQARIPPAS